MSGIQQMVLGGGGRGPGAPVVVSIPEINGTVATGSVVTATPAVVTGTPTPTLSARQWFADGIAIFGATNISYLITGGEEGKTLTVGETWSNTDGSVGTVSLGTVVTKGLEQVFMFAGGDATWTVPPDWNNANNIIHVIGGGGRGVPGGEDGDRFGGGGGAYAAALNVALTPGEVLSVFISAGEQGSGPGQGRTFSGLKRQDTTWVVMAEDALIFNNGRASQCVGDVKFDGGNGYAGPAGPFPGGGGAGAAGPAGAGGSCGPYYGTAQNQPATGGGGANGGTSGYPYTFDPPSGGGDGGENNLGVGGGKGSATEPPTQSFSGGGGAGGAGGLNGAIVSSYGVVGGGWGSTDPVWAPAVGPSWAPGVGPGSGAGGGGGVWDVPLLFGTPGQAGLYGGGGGGCAVQEQGPLYYAQGAPGMILIEYGGNTTIVPPSTVTAPALAGPIYAGFPVGYTRGVVDGYPKPGLARVQWNADGVPIPGAWFPTYIPQASDIGKVLTVTEYWMNTQTPVLVDSNGVTVETPATFTPTNVLTAAYIASLTGYGVSGGSGSITGQINGMVVETLVQGFNAPYTVTLTLRTPDTQVPQDFINSIKLDSGSNNEVYLTARASSFSANNPNTPQSTATWTWLYALRNSITSGQCNVWWTA